MKRVSLLASRAVSVFFILALALPSRAQVPTPVAPNSNATIYRSVVKINSYYLDPSGLLTHYDQGSGVIINASGLVLTNHHVVSITSNYDGSVVPAAYQICLPGNDVAAEPDCAYTADLIASDEQLDVALLQIHPITSLNGQSTFSPLTLATSDTTSVSDPIVAYGYPAIGGETITVTNGVISGKVDQYGEHWLKTDAVTSFGSSGGAAVDAQGNVIGITSASHSDLLGSLGYVESMASLSSWVQAHQNDAPKSSSFTARVEKLSERQHQLETTNTWTNPYQGFAITKPAAWKFNQDDEGGMAITSDSDTGGEVDVSFVTTPFTNVSATLMAPLIKFGGVTSGRLSLYNITKDVPVTLGSVHARQIVLSAAGQSQVMYALANGRYLIEVDIDYGDSDKDKSVVEDMLKSIKLSPILKYTAPTTVSNGTPSLHLTTTSAWLLQPRLDRARPVMAWHKTLINSFFTIGVTKIDSQTIHLTNSGYLAYLAQKLKELNQVSGTIDANFAVTKTQASRKISKALPNVVQLTVTESLAKEKTVLLRETEYIFRHGDSYYEFDVDTLSSSATDHAKATADAEKLLQQFSF